MAATVVDSVDLNLPQAACHVFRARGIPYTYWFEYALRHHGSRTVVFTLYLLVVSVREAENCLRSLGWTSAERSPYDPQFYDPAVDEQVVLSRGDSEYDAVALMSSYQWPGIVPSADDNDRAHYAPLPQLYNALVQRLLDTDCWSFRMYLNLQISYLHLDCPALASPDFLAALPPDIRQFNLDWRSETLRMHTDATVQHERKIRAQAREGRWKLMYEGSAELGGTKIDREYEAKLLATLESNERQIS
ncbi:hypothetical protein PYCCODRAFT_402717 [Trametes coccinea BRFM310]|uniref:Uncharacterized protein n=1 Tax=Trametes coccinea (strain BRFM310) TaxID=1353009 RepID=A0A1Y2IQD4_TRAC3|nr:hypothetical protein PYCCODRAFT_402717 [Trametes coccinea BRFM310]